MAADASHAASFSVADARKLIADLFTPSPWVFWADLLLSLAIGYTAALVYLQAPLFSPQQVLCYFIAGFALFRAASFMHEIVHFRRGEMVGFKVAWNLLAGIPMLVPSFLYESHLVHHNTRHYGTVNDGEYLPLGIGRFRNLFGFLGQIAFLPAFVAMRFLILTPISFLHPRLRAWVLERASSYVINLSYRRAIPPAAPRKIWALVELACFLRVAAIFVLVGLGLSHWSRIPLLYALAMLTLGINHVRTLVAHRYQSSGEQMDHRGQIDDSVNIRGGWFFTELFFPVGLRWHALHHVYPSIPYHNLGRAHRRLTAGLPADSAYHRITYRGFWSAVVALLKSSREACKQPPPGADLWYARRQEMNRPVSPHEADGDGAPADGDGEGDPAATAERTAPADAAAVAERPVSAR